MTARGSNKRIGVLTSGGDCAGLNAIIRAVVNRAKRAHGWKIIGIRCGSDGLIDRPVDVVPLDFDAVPGYVMMRSGTILGTTSRGNPFHAVDADGNPDDRSDAIIEGYASLELDALIGIGGDGSLDILNRLTKLGGINFIGVPKTIDNDVPLTEFSVGFSTAVNTAVEALDRLQPTAASHERVMILEVMGRDAGHIALTAGIAGGELAPAPSSPPVPQPLARRRRLAESGVGGPVVIRCASSLAQATTLEVDDGEPQPPVV